MSNVTISATIPGKRRLRELQASSTAQLNKEMVSSELNDLKTQAAGQAQVIAGFFLASANSKIDMNTVSMEGTQGSVASAVYV
mmetsp:Transcript_8885/g.10911  ORF Transcript_8885/g.10911 Transcript_8885/m.10911 type:complete len:83 (+) Transcript_8885:547-795(+)